METNDSWKKLSLIQIGGLMSSPILFVGYSIGLNRDFNQALLLIISGNLVLFILAYAYAMLFTCHQTSTVEFAGYYLGDKGKALTSFFLFISMIGWSAIQLDLISEVFGYLHDDAQYLFIICALLISCFICRKRLNLLSKINLIFSPILFSLLVLSCFQHAQLISVVPHTDSHSLSSAQGISLVILACLGMVFDLPTFYCTAKNPNETRKSLVILFLLALPIIEILGSIFSYSIGQAIDSETLPFILSINRSFLFFGAFLISGIVGNAMNLYSASIIFKNRKPTFTHITCLLYSALFSLIAYFVLKKINFIAFLESINLFLMLIGGVILFKGYLMGFKKRGIGVSNKHDVAKQIALNNAKPSISLINESDAAMIARGAELLGSGGGGNAEILLSLAVENIRKYGPIKLIKYHELPNDSLIIPLAMIGSPEASTKQLPRLGEFESLLEFILKDFPGLQPILMPAEIGGCNALAPFAIAAKYQLPILDADLIGRAFPEVPMCAPAIEGGFQNFAYLNAVNHFPIRISFKTAQELEYYARNKTASWGGSAIIAAFLYTSRELSSKKIILGSLRRAHFLGQFSCIPPEATYVANGVIENIISKNKNGFLIGQVSIKTDDQLFYQVYFKNEFLRCIQHDTLIESSPNIIGIWDDENSRPIMSECLKKNRRVTIISLPAPIFWENHASLVNNII